MREPPAATDRHHLLSARLNELNQLDETLVEIIPPALSGWCVFRSDAGRYWATRKSFGDADEAAGVWRTVDADDPEALARLIAEQEHRAGPAS
ncbi:immunoglobulin domain-containing family protein [Sphaerisporangium aureirubrum]|uniref:Uncharacterized protein n=1 Tax=Sphaerisporangium aureirubrum TaxID=1544736 RepID=A0ABW1NQD3_9ACTN